jgi:uncharacterized membrane protein
MIYKIFLPCFSCFSFLQAICSSQRLKQKTKENKTEVKQKKNTSESNAEVVYNNLNSNQFALQIKELYKAWVLFIEGERIS